MTINVPRPADIRGSRGGGRDGCRLVASVVLWGGWEWEVLGYTVYTLLSSSSLVRALSFSVLLTVAAEKKTALLLVNQTYVLAGRRILSTQPPK